MDLNAISALVVAAAQACGLHNRIMDLPKNYWTVIGTEQDAAAARAQHAAHVGELQGECGSGTVSAQVHVPSPADGELLALARKNYLALRAAQRRQRVAPQWRCKHVQRPLGAVPDFAEVHRALAETTIRTRQVAVAAGLTLPLEYELARGSMATVQARRRQAACARLKAGAGDALHPWHHEVCCMQAQGPSSCWFRRCTS